ncbi:hypothetical protein [Sedimenticola selenatireducens]|uniref:hypothetical protein n=1 Tax=Sedimenticola selenatireducens TaxID=191960 RepID=UPI002AAB5263|nr:hypothetical protein [Sedimenticola selenatireducens]
MDTIKEALNTKSASEIANLATLRLQGLAAVAYQVGSDSFMEMNDDLQLNYGNSLCLGIRDVIDLVNALLTAKVEEEVQS